jgi:DNA-directed RNA polymerase subunit alpha
MENIPLPKKISYKVGDNNNTALVTIEPLFPGYGTTVGNALRRVLLSSLTGAAVTAVRIKNVPHEYATLNKVSEDVLQIILNLKQLRMKVHSEEGVKLTLSVKGEKTVTAADFDANSDVEISNKDLVIAQLTGKDADLEMEVWVQKGRGFEPTEARADEKREIGVISVDAFYSPVRRVALNVDRARVGQMTNFDKVTLEIETDGTVSVEDAVKASSKILVEQFASIGNISEEVQASVEETDGAESDDTENSVVEKLESEE